MGAHGCQRAAAYGPEGMTQAGGGSQTCCKAGAASGGSCMFSGAAGVCVRRGIRGGGTRSPCRGVKVASTPSTCISLNQAASHSLTLSTVGYVNCLIYLVCSMAPLGPTPPTLVGTTEAPPATQCWPSRCREPRARPYSKPAHSTLKYGLDSKETLARGDI